MNNPIKKKSLLIQWCWIFYFTFPVWALALHWAQWDWGFRALRTYGVLKLLVWFLGALIFVRSILIFPLVKWVWRVEPQRLSRSQLIAYSTVVLSLPLVAFCYFIGDVKTFAQAQEVSITVIPAVLLSTLIYDVTRSEKLWTAALTALVFYPVFLVNEILGPFQTYIYLLAQDNRYEYVRGLVPALAVAAYYRYHYPSARSSTLSGINAIHHAWKSSRFSQMFQSTNPGESSLKSETESGVGN